MKRLANWVFTKLNGPWKKQCVVWNTGFFQ